MKRLLVVLALFIVSFIGFNLFFVTLAHAKILNKELVDKVILLTGYKASICTIAIDYVVSLSITPSETSFFNNPSAFSCESADTLVFGDVVLYLKDGSKVFEHVILFNDMILRQDSLSFDYYDDGSIGGTFIEGSGEVPLTKLKFVKSITLHNTDPKLPGGQEALSSSGITMHYSPNGQVGQLLFVYKGQGYKLTEVISKATDVTLVDYTQEVSLPPFSSPATNNQEDLILEKLSFSIPSGWWHETGVNSFSINPTPLPRPSDAVPAFHLLYYPNTTVEQKKQELTNGLTVTGERKIKIAKVYGYEVKGTYETGPLQGENITIAIFSLDEGIYYLENLNAKYAIYFDQIISTFKPVE